MSALTDIVGWSENRPAWQRDALRRLVLGGALGTQDIDELAQLAKEKHGLLAEGPPLEHESLASTHLPAAPSTHQVSLKSIVDPENVNALASGQELSFQDKGLTLVYGNNASGKSGYVRVLKKVCRARGADVPILPNVFSPGAKPGASASISYMTGGNQVEIAWCEDVAADDDLSAVSVFDSSSAAVYVNEENDVAYLPFGLDLLHKLVELCDTIRADLQRDLEAAKKQLPAIPPELAGTSAAKELSAVSKKTTVAEITKLTSFSPAEAQRRASLHAVLAEKSPDQQAQQVEGKRDRYKKLHERLAASAKVVRKDSVNKLEAAVEDFRKAKMASAVADAQKSEGLPIGISGSDLWRVLWGAAEDFLQEVHAPHKLTLDDQVERCPLCQRPLDEETRIRFATFSDYFYEKATGDEAKKLKVVEDLSEPFANLELANNLFAEVIPELKLDNQSLSELIAEYLRDCRRLQVYTEALGEGQEEGKKPAIPELDRAPLLETVKLLDFHAGELRVASDPKSSEALRSEALELSAKEWMHNQKLQIQAELKRLDRCSRFSAAISDTATQGITQKTTELTEFYVKGELRSAFLSELESLTRDAPDVELVSSPGAKGVSYYRLQLVGASSHEKSIAQVLSEGELRAISLAAFLSELSTEESNSGVVFDDPISSQDVHNRELVAERLVGLAAERQVIIFTHDLFFLVSLRDLAEKENIPVDSLLLTKLPVGSGVVSRDEPWVAKNFKRQLSSLKERCVKAQGLTDAGDFESVRKSICNDVRKLVECAVEEVLLSNIVRRYRRNLFVSNVKRLQAIDATDVDLLDKLMAEYSKHSHSQVLESDIPLPSLNSIENDLESIASWAKQFREKAGGV